jgi:hypothetical protein
MSLNWHTVHTTFYENPSGNSRVFRSYRGTLPDMTFLKADDGINDYDVIMHAQMIMDNGFPIVSPHDFAHPSRWYHRLQEI